MRQLAFVTSAKGKMTLHNVGQRCPHNKCTALKYILGSMRFGSQRRNSARPESDQWIVRVNMMRRMTMRLLPNEHLCFLCANLTVSVLHCPADPALIRSDNTVRNEISTIGLQSLSSYSKGLLKHSAALPLSPSISPFFCFSSSISPLFLQLFLFSLPSLSPYYSPLSIFCAGETRAWMPHTVSESPALRQHCCHQIFSVWNESLGRFFFFFTRQETVVKLYSHRALYISGFRSVERFVVLRVYGFCGHMGSLGQVLHIAHIKDKHMFA